MNSERLLFNRNPIVFGTSIEQPSEELVRNTLGLFNASIEDAVKYGGELTRAALGAMNLRNDRRFIVVDTKVHMLIPGMSPAIPGWHTDGVPRGPLRDSIHHGLPDLYAQERKNIRPHRYHLLVTGSGCLTEFLLDPIELPFSREPDAQIYNRMSKWTNDYIKGWVEDDPTASFPKGCREDIVQTAPSCRIVEFDWWNIHQGVVATKKEWRYLIRVMETDMAEPERDLRNVIRTQQQVYAPMNFGW